MQVSRTIALSVMIIMMVAFALGWGLAAQSPVPRTVGATRTYASGWVQASNAQHNKLRFVHGLKEPVTRLAVWFSPDANGSVSYPILGFWDQGYTGNPVTIRVDSEAIELEIYSGAPLHGAWDVASGWTTYKEGYYRVIVN
jgi:hypothetical protein